MLRVRTVGLVVFIVEGIACGGSTATEPTDAGACATEGATADASVRRELGDGGDVTVDAGAPRRRLPDHCRTGDYVNGTVDDAQLSGSCSADMLCPPGMQCTSFEAADFERPGFFCAPDDPCLALRCSKGSHCKVLSSFPAMAYCHRDPR